MRKITAASLLVLLIASTVPLLDLEGDEVEGVITSYHNAHLQVNLTISPGVPAPNHNILVKNLNQFETYITMRFTTNDTGIRRVIMDPIRWGACRIFCADSTGSYVISKDLYVEPDGDYYLDLMLQDGLVDTNTISGKVRNSTDGSLLSGIRVWFYGQDIMQNDLYKEMTTGPDGKFNFTFPNLTGTMSVRALGPSHHERTWAYQYIDGKDSYTLDLTLDPIIGAGEGFTVRFHESDTGDPLWGDFYISGYSINNGHAQQAPRYLSANETGWHKVPFGAGEYRPQMSLYKNGNITINLNRFINVNSSGEAFDFGFELPDLRTVKIIVKNGTDTIDSASVSYSEYLDHGRMEMHGNGMTLGDGSVYLSLPTDHPTRLYVSAYYHEGIDLVYDPTTGSDTLEIALKETDYGSGDSAMVTIVPTDEVTGYSLVGDIEFTNDLGRFGTLRTNDTGVLQAEIEPGFYPRIGAVTVMGVGHVDNVTLVKGANERIVIPIERSDQSSSVHPIYTVKVVDEDGAPLAYQSFKVFVQDPPTFSLLTTDATGTLTFASDEGMVRITRDIDYSGMLPQWTIAGTDLFPDGSGGPLGQITAYSTTPLTEISGFVRDQVTMTPLPHAFIYTNSLHDLSEGYPDLDSLVLYSMDTGSDDSGLYRIWGKDHVMVESGYEGYYPYLEVLEAGSTGPIPHDVLLEPVPERDIYVNGTVTDDNGDPVIAWVTAQDEEHPNYNVDHMETGSDGEFSLRLYAGNFTIKCENDTLESNVSLTLTEDVEGLVLKLIPYSEIDVLVVDWGGVPVSGITVDAMIKEGTFFKNLVSADTDTDGAVVFTLPPGTYKLSIEHQSGYGRHSTEEFVLTGWNDLSLEIMLENATTGSLSGKVSGDGGPYPGGIPGATVSLYKGNASIANATCDAGGDYRLEEVPFGTYIVIADPPLDLTFEQGVTSGYSYINGTVVIGPGENSFDAELPFSRMTSDEYLNITRKSPTGMGVSLDAPIIIDFSHALDAGTSFGSIITVDPSVENLAFDLANGGRTLMLSHDLFAVNTTYTVTILPLLASDEGHPMWETSIITWDFTTGEAVAGWELYSVVVSTNPLNRTVTVTAIGKAGIEVLIVIDDIGSFELNEITSGSYAGTVPGTMLDYNTSYSYHFSNVTDGPDLAPALAGTFMTGEDPFTWSITSATVKVDKEKQWSVVVLGGPGQDVFIVIDGVGSFKLMEVSPGRYETTIPGSMFDWDEEYAYHFSPTSGGIAPAGFESFSGSIGTGAEPKDETNWSAIAGISCFVILIMVVLIAVILIFAIRKKGKTTGWEE